jgi:predicted Ser/Thr protein kinase
MTKTTCSKCGATIPGGRSSCPRCLLELSRALEPAEAASDPAPIRRAPPPTPAELAGDFPELEVLELVGQGGMGCVYRARHRQLDRVLALKILAPGAEHDARFEERFLREARALARLDHPGIVRVHDFGRAGSRWYLAMEFVEGSTLRTLLREGRVTSDAALDIVPQLCDALQYAHDEGVVHRDIKPENVLVDAKGRVKIADFGLAKLVGRADEHGARTGSEQVMGTPHYMAPEQARSSRNVDHRADIYSLGVVFYELLTGELPIGRFEAPSKRAGVDVRLDGIVMKSLERAPELRYQHAVDVRTDVEGLAASDASAAPSASAPRASPGEATPPLGAHAAVSDASSSSRASAAWNGLKLLGWLAAILAAWLVFWVSLGDEFAFVALPAVSVLVLAFVRSDAAPNARPLRFAAAFVLHALGGLAFAVHCVHRWDSSTPDYATAYDRGVWDGAGVAKRAVELAVELIGMSPASEYHASRVAGTHTGWWPVFEQGHWGLVAIALWLAAAAALFMRARRWSWNELVHPTLVLVGVSALTAWLAVERSPLGGAPERIEVEGSLDAPLSLDRARPAIERLADAERLGTRIFAEWKVTHERGWESGTALHYVLEDEAPWRRWRFDLLDGPQRLTPRISLLYFKLPGRIDARIEVRLGALAAEPAERVAQWRALAARLLEGLRPR